MSALTSPTVADVVCGDCLGTAVDIDTDGSLSGVLGAVIPCVCLVGDDFGQSPLCGCHAPEWPYNDGFTGWLSIPLAERGDDEAPGLRSCSVHAPLPPVTLAPAVGAAL